MKHLSALGGLPVVCEGTRVGRVLVAQLTPDLRRLGGLHVDLGLRGRRFLPAERVRVLGDVAVVAEDGFAPAPREGARLPARALSPAGARLGCITGAWLDEATREVAALELSCGYWEDLFSGRVPVRFYRVRRGGGEIVIYGEGGEEE